MIINQTKYYTIEADKKQSIITIILHQSINSAKYIKTFLQYLIKAINIFNKPYSIIVDFAMAITLGDDAKEILYESIIHAGNNGMYRIALVMNITSFINKQYFDAEKINNVTYKYFGDYLNSYIWIKE